MTDKEFEKKLNKFYEETLTEEEAIEKFSYLASKQRKERTTERNILKQYKNKQLGTLLHRLDPIAFNVRKSEYEQ